MTGPLAPPCGSSPHDTPAALDVADRTLLEYFPQSERSTIANLFLGQVRQGEADTPGRVYLAALDELRGRCARALDLARQPWTSGDYWRESTRRLAEQADLLARHPEEGAAYGRWCLAWAALPPEERERRKRDKGQGYARAAMDKQPATEKQIGYLQRMGYSGPIDSKQHASALIDLYTRGQRVTS